MILSLAFSLDRAVYASPIETVEEVLPFLPIEPVHGAPAFLKGVVFVRGHLIPILDATERLRVRRSSPAPIDPHIIAFRIEGRLTGLIVDEAIDLVELPADGRTTGAELMVEPGLFDGMVEREGTLYRLINPGRLLRPGETATVDQAREPGQT